MNSKILLVVCFAIVCAAGSPLLSAQPSAPPTVGQSIPTDSAPETKGGWPTPEEIVARMNNKLNLSDDQKTKITSIIADRQARMKGLTADTSTRRLQKARKAKSIMSDSDKKIEAVLTKDQKKTYEQMKEEMREQIHARLQERNSSSIQ